MEMGRRRRRIVVVGVMLFPFWDLIAVAGVLPSLIMDRVPSLILVVLLRLMRRRTARPLLKSASKSKTENKVMIAAVNSTTKKSRGERSKAAQNPKLTNNSYRFSRAPLAWPEEGSSKKNAD